MISIHVHLCQKFDGRFRLAPENQGKKFYKAKAFSLQRPINSVPEFNALQPYIIEDAIRTRGANNRICYSQTGRIARVL